MNISKKEPIIIAHRGASKDAPENTLAAFALAVQHGCDAIELDIHLSVDNEFIVCHDEHINRTTNGSGKIADMTVPQLKSFDCGQWFNEKFRGEKIPLLEEVFELVPSHILINIELKIPHKYPDIERKLTNFLIRKNRIDSVVVSSFDHQCLHRLKKLESRVKIGLLYMSNLVEHYQYTRLFNVPIYSLHPYFLNIGEEDIRKAKKKNLEVYTWTVNEEKEMAKLIQAGVTGIITDCPQKLKLIRG
ncbi:glycerophosphodiester phosphodiesterase [Alkalihalobacillus sp. 1P02AB]|uniref:glycerophosphodiester phosphodiesterase n=1 Tax=Alkalihalobacillus sp. 1P02AB TaxID=3132260 RepID=UPI0039A66A10